MKTIESENLLFRPIVYDDTDMVLKWRNSDAVNRNFLYRKEVTREDHIDWLNNKVATGKVKQFVIIEKTGLKPIGSVYFRDIEEDIRQAQYGIFIGEADARGKGYGSETAVRMVKYFFEEMKYDKLYLKALARNTTAIKSYERAGFKIDENGDFGEQFDEDHEKVIFMSMTEDDYREKVCI